MNSAFHVSICGGGIAGLMLALIIGKYSSLPVEIFESGPTITTIGAGIVLFGRTMDIMKELGLHDELVKIAIGPPQENGGPVLRKSDQRDGYHWFAVNLKWGPLSFHRKDLIDFLLRHVLASCKVHTSKKLELYDVNPETGKVRLQFRDGSSVTTDVLVGADGIRSATRKTMYQRLASLIPDDDSRKRLLGYSEPVWTGTLVYRNLVPTAKLAKEYPDAKVPTDLLLYLGKNKHMVIFPVSQGRSINVVIFCGNPEAFGTPFEGRWVMDVSEKEVLDQFEDWEIHAKALAKCIEKPSRWALHSLPLLPHYVNERVALIGDAAHAMEPHFGAGAGQAIEDALVLGRLLTHELTHRGNVADALKIYEQVRLPFANGVSLGSQNVGRYYDLHLQHHVPVDGSAPVPDHADTPEKLEHIRKSIEDGWKWQNEPVRVWEEAEERWRASCSGSSSSNSNTLATS